MGWRIHCLRKGYCCLSEDRLSAVLKLFDLRTLLHPKILGPLYNNMYCIRNLNRAILKIERASIKMPEWWHHVPSVLSWENESVQGKEHSGIRQMSMTLWAPEGVLGASESLDHTLRTAALGGGSQISPKGKGCFSLFMISLVKEPLVFN